jgi:hypothetical protein
MLTCILSERGLRDVSGAFTTRLYHYDQLFIHTWFLLSRLLTLPSRPLTLPSRPLVLHLVLWFYISSSVFLRQLRRCISRAPGADRRAGTREGD